MQTGGTVFVDLSVIIRGYNNKDLILPLIDSIVNDIKAHSYEIIYVDNASSDGTVSAMKELFSDIIVIENAENFGPCKATNIGLDKACGRILCILDSDTKVISGVDGMIKYMLNTDKCAAASGKILNHDGSLQLSISSFPTLSRAFVVSLMHLGLGRLVSNTAAARKYYMQDFDPNQINIVFKIPLCCFFIKAEAFKIIGKQDERMFMYFEDVDWCFRLRAHDLQIHYNPTLKMVHYGGQTTSRKDRSPQMHRIYYHSLKVFCAKHIYPNNNFLYNSLVKILIEVRQVSLYLSRIFLNNRFVGGAGYKKKMFTSDNQS